MFFILLVSSISVVSKFFKHFYNANGCKNHYPVDSAIRPSYNRHQVIHLNVWALNSLLITYIAGCD